MISRLALFLMSEFNRFFLFVPILIKRNVPNTRADIETAQIQLSLPVFGEILLLFLLTDTDFSFLFLTLVLVVFFCAAVDCFVAVTSDFAVLFFFMFACVELVPVLYTLFVSVGLTVFVVSSAL